MLDMDSFESLVPLSDDLHEMTTRRGKFRRFLYQFRFMVCPVAVLMIPFVVLCIVFGSRLWEVLRLPTSPPELESLLPLQQQLNETSRLYSKLSLKNGILEIHGNGSKPLYNFPMSGITTTAYFQYFDEFPGIEASLAALGQNMSTSIHSLHIKWFKVNADEISTELRSFPELQTLKMDNVSIFNFFRPVALLELREFFLYQILEDEQNTMEEYKVHNYYNLSNTTTPNPFLDSTFFFMGEKFDGFIPALRSTPVNISVWLDGSIVFSRDMTNHEIRLSIRTCHPIFYPPPTNLNTSYDHVTLANCNDLEPNSVPPLTKTLDLYLLQRDSMSSDLLHKMLQRLTKLEELFVELPEKDVVLNLDSLPSTLRILSVSSMPINISNMMDSSRTLTFPRLTKFYFGGSNQYRWIKRFDNRTEKNINSFIISNFNQIFPKLQEAAMFELENDGGYAFLQMLLNSSAKVITVQGFPRSESSNTSTVGQEIETLLDAAGIGKSTKFFELRKVNGELKGRSLDYMEQIERRYWMLAWSAIDSWDKYVHVRQLIDNEFYLG